jgi:hypothetical protein
MTLLKDIVQMIFTPVPARKSREIDHARSLNVVTSFL